jgi:putative tryptophan/tyrosine transport system substrate-binding protein
VKRREFITLLGGAAAWPLAARGQQPVRMSRIAIVHPVVPPEVMRENSESPFYRSFFSELRRLGYIEGKDIVIERRSGEGRTDRYSEIARELVGLKPDVMVVTSARIPGVFPAGHNDHTYYRNDRRPDPIQHCFQRVPPGRKRHWLQC